MNDDFKFDDLGYNPQEKTTRTRRKRSGLKFIFVIVLSLAAGVSVYFVSNTMFGKKTNSSVVIKEKELDITDEGILSLYQSVTYGALGNRYDKYLKEQQVLLQNFSNYEKFYYALQYLSLDDFVDTKEVDASNGLSIYSLSSDKVKSYMRRYFGNKITYSMDSSISLSVPFQINGNNTGVLSYDKSRASYVITFSDNLPNFSGFSNYNSKLVRAVQKADGSIVLTEKIIYPSIQQEGVDLYSCFIYRDYYHTMLIEKKEGLTTAQLENEISVEQYLDSANTITYTFHKNTDGNYYFYSSKIRD